MSGSAPAGRPTLLWPTLGTLLACALLVALGIWQIQRLAWKTTLLDTIVARTTAPPVPLPPEDTWAALAPDAIEYRHVTVTGRFEHDKEALVFRPLAIPRGGPFSGIGDLVITPLRLPSGAVVLVNRGFVPEERKDPAMRAQGQVAGLVTLTGLMREPESRNLFTPADDPDHRLWYTRDPASIASALGLTRVAPFTIDQDRTAVPGGLPQAGETVLDIPNNHLSYAMTWFGLALAVLIVYAVSVWRSRNSVSAPALAGDVEPVGDVVQREDRSPSRS